MKESFKLSMLAIACSIALSACGSSGGGTPSAQSAPTPQQPGNKDRKSVV